MYEDIKTAVEVLRAGGLILYPTDTVWGIGCDATNEAAVLKLLAIKKRSSSKPMLVLVDNPTKIQTCIAEMPDIAWDLIEMSEKPLTIVYPDAKGLAPSLIGKDKTIGIRVTNEEFSRKLCSQFRKPIVSTSANISGQKTPADFSHISPEIKSKVDYIVSYRQSDKSKVDISSVIELGKGNLFRIIRD